ncbi:MAG: hypothetical protein J5779_00320 [Clostridia bacterium]|nr:hypothetical protein [Clostridia bacterium]
MAIKIDKDKIATALFKKAVGYDFEESVEEFCVNENGEMVKNKEKINKKHLPPDVPAVKALFELCVTDTGKYDNMTEEELLIERAKLLEELKN